MRKLLCAAAVFVAMSASASAETYSCEPYISDRDPNPVVKTILVVPYESRGKYYITHQMADGSTRERGAQYYKTRAFGLDGGGFVWNGRLKSNPHVTIVGKFNADNGTYVESWFHDGKFTNKVVMRDCSIDNGWIAGR